MPNAIPNAIKNVLFIAIKGVGSGMYLNFFFYNGKKNKNIYLTLLIISIKPKKIIIKRKKKQKTSSHAFKRNNIPDFCNFGNNSLGVADN